MALNNIINSALLTNLSILPVTTTQSTSSTATTPSVIVPLHSSVGTLAQGQCNWEKYVLCVMSDVGGCVFV